METSSIVLAIPSIVDLENDEAWSNTFDDLFSPCFIGELVGNLKSVIGN